MHLFKKFSYILTIFFFFVLANIAFSANAETPLDAAHDQIIEEISVYKASEMIEANKGSNEFVILDLRTPDEYKQEHIEDAQNVDFFSEGFRTELSNLDKDKTYIIHCRSGKRAGKTAPIMKELGFKRVYSMGGVVQWKEAGFETIKTE